MPPASSVDRSGSPSRPAAARGEQPPRGGPRPARRGGAEWLVQRRVAAAEQLDTRTWPTPAEEIWRYSRIDELDVARYQPFTADELGAPGEERAPGGGPWAAEA